MKRQLFEDEEGEEDEIKVNEGYAKAYKRRKRMEEESRIRDQLRALEEGSQSYSSSSEDTDELITWNDTHEKKFRTVMQFLKGDMPFDQKSIPQESDKIEKREKPHVAQKVTVKDALMQQLREGEEEEVEKEGNRLLYNKEQAALKKAFLDQVDAWEAEDDDDELFAAKPNPSGEKQKELENGQKWSEKDGEAVLASYWRSEALDEKDAYLRDYIVEEKWLERDEVEARFQEIHEKLQESEEEVEEATAEHVVRYPRELTSLRAAKETGKKKKRKKEKEKKSEKVEKRRKEMRKLQHQMEDILAEKQAKLVKESGLDADSVKPLVSQLYQKFDPDTHDAALLDVYDDQFYDPSSFSEKVEKRFAKKVPREELSEGSREESSEWEDSEDSVVNDIMKAIRETEVYKSARSNRFTYATVKPKSFGFTESQLLELDEAILKKRMPVKKLAPYR